MTLTADGGYFRDVLLGRADGMKGFMEGKLQLAGDLNLAMKLTSFFKMGG
jgi:putative sterol carrier protein